MVSYAGNPYGLGYQTSKKALTACFDVWSQHVRGDGPGFQAGHPGARPDLDLYDGPQAPPMDGPYQGSLFGVAEGNGPRHLPVCANAPEEADPPLAGLRGVRRDALRKEGPSWLAAGAPDARRQTTPERQARLHGPGGIQRPAIDSPHVPVARHRARAGPRQTRRGGGVPRRVSRQRPPEREGAGRRPLRRRPVGRGSDPLRVRRGLSDARRRRPRTRRPRTTSAGATRSPT